MSDHPRLIWNPPAAGQLFDSMVNLRHSIMRLVVAECARRDPGMPPDKVKREIEAACADIDDSLVKIAVAYRTPTMLIPIDGGEANG